MCALVTGVQTCALPIFDRLREDTELTSDFWEIFVVDPMHRPVGSCQLSWILRTPRDIAIGDVMKREQTLIPVDMDQEEVALRFQKYALISAAVVDKAGRLVGMITVDDIVHIIQERSEERRVGKGCVSTCRSRGSPDH